MNQSSLSFEIPSDVAKTELCSVLLRFAELNTLLFSQYFLLGFIDRVLLLLHGRVKTAFSRLELLTGAFSFAFGFPERFSITYDIDFLPTELKRYAVLLF
jgi:hypothetical protein